MKNQLKMITPEEWKCKAERLAAKDPLAAWFAMGHYYLLSDDEAGCIKVYACAVDTFLSKASPANYASITDEISLIDMLKTPDPRLPEKIKLYLNIALVLAANSSDKDSYKHYIELHKIRTEPFKKPIVIIAGGASLMDENKADNYRDHINKIMRGFKGTIISGGTTAGIPGLVGRVKKYLQKQSPVDFELVAYLPEKLPAGAVISKYYDIFYATNADQFSSLDILTYWTDLICNGINPADVILIGIDGGEIALMEYQMALSLGAKVGLVAHSGRAASGLLQDEYWKSHRNLSQIPDNPGK